MARYAIIANNVIVNVVNWDGGPQWSPPSGTMAVATNAGDIGWLWNGGNPVNPNPPPPPDPGDGGRGLILRRIADLEALGDIPSQIAALKLRIQLLGG